MLFLTLTGRMPYEGAPIAIVKHQEKVRERREPAPSPRALVPDVPEALDALCRRALQLDPAHRFGSAASFAQALDAVAHGKAIVFAHHAHGAHATAAHPASAPLPVAGAPSAPGLLHLRHPVRHLSTTDRRIGYANRCLLLLSLVMPVFVVVMIFKGHLDAERWREQARQAREQGLLERARAAAQAREQAEQARKAAVEAEQQARAAREQVTPSPPPGVSPIGDAVKRALLGPPLPARLMHKHARPVSWGKSEAEIYACAQAEIWTPRHRISLDFVRAPGSDPARATIWISARPVSGDIFSELHGIPLDRDNPRDKPALVTLEEARAFAKWANLSTLEVDDLACVSAQQILRQTAIPGTPEWPRLDDSKPLEGEADPRSRPNFGPADSGARGLQAFRLVCREAP